MKTNKDLKNIEPLQINQMEERQEAASHGSAKVKLSNGDPCVQVGCTIYF